MFNYRSFIIIPALLLAGCDNEASAPQEQVFVRPSAAIEAECKRPYNSALTSGSNNLMRNALADINGCLENEIITAATTRLAGAQSVPTIEKSLQLLSTGYQRIMWEIATEDVTCRPNCGSISQLSHLSAYNTVLLDLLDRLLAIEPQ